MGCSGSSMFGMLDIRDVGCEMLDVSWDVRCSKNTYTFNTFIYLQYTISVVFN